MEVLELKAKIRSMEEDAVKAKYQVYPIIPAN
jgi:hypothetical protein